MSGGPFPRDLHAGVQAIVAADREACREVEAMKARLLAAEETERRRCAETCAAAADAARARLDCEIAAVDAAAAARAEARRAARDAARAERRRLADAALPAAVSAYVAVVRGPMGGGP